MLTPLILRAMDRDERSIKRLVCGIDRWARSNGFVTLLKIGNGFVGIRK
jgi:hypothetical protein